jgi:hypothetical protein
VTQVILVNPMTVTCYRSGCVRNSIVVVAPDSRATTEAMSDYRQARQALISECKLLELATSSGASNLQ